MTIHGLKLREVLKTGKLQRLIWCDTRSMLADELNTGTVDRDSIQRAVYNGEWSIDQEVLIHQTQMPIAERSQEQPE